MISVIITFSGSNPDKFANFYELIKCIKSQDYNNYEIVVVEQYNDSALLCDLTNLMPDAKYKAVRNDIFNLSWCRNIGATISSGDILLFIDSNLVFDRRYFSKVLEEFRSDYSIGWNRLVKLNRQGREIYMRSKEFTTDWNEELINDEIFPSEKVNCFQRFASIFDRNFYFNQLGGYNENFTDTSEAESDIVIRAKALTGIQDRLDYTLAHLYYEDKEDTSNSDIINLSLKYPLRISKRLLGVKLGNFKHPTYINLDGLRKYGDDNNLLLARKVSENNEMMPRKQMVSFLAEVFGNKPVIGAEIGVYEGQNAISMLRALNLKKLYLIDPYTIDDKYQDTLNNVVVLSKAREHASRIMQNYSNIIEWIYLKSDDALDLIKDELDFAYIDANHVYEYAKRDINNYYRLVKPFGYLGGHDYRLSYKPGTIEVKKAVNEFVEEYGYDLTIGSFAFPDWWIQK